VAAGVAAAVADGIIPAAEADGLLLIAAVWVDWVAEDAASVFENNLRATRAALEAGATGEPGVDTVLVARHAPANPFFTAVPR
jgi:5,6,7,8-tetrahydromethanopterin hydro-lyase